MSMLSMMRMFSIRIRMVGAIGVVLVLLSMLGGAGMWGMFRIQTLSQNFIDNTFSDAGHLSRLQFELGRVLIRQKEMIIEYEKPLAVKATMKLWSESLDRATAQCDSLAGSGSAEVKQASEDIKKQLTAYAAANRWQPSWTTAS